MHASHLSAHARKVFDFLPLFGDLVRRPKVEKNVLNDHEIFGAARSFSLPGSVLTTSLLD